MGWFSGRWWHGRWFGGRWWAGAEAGPPVVASLVLGGIDMRPLLAGQAEVRHMFEGTGAWAGQAISGRVMLTPRLAGEVDAEPALAAKIRTDQ